MEDEIERTAVNILIVRLYNYLTTLDMEVQLVWSQRKLSLGLCLFLLNRYVPFITVAIASYYILIETNFDYSVLLDYYRPNNISPRANLLVNSHLLISSRCGVGTPTLAKNIIDPGILRMSKSAAHIGCSLSSLNIGYKFGQHIFHRQTHRIWTNYPKFVLLRVFVFVFGEKLGPFGLVRSLRFDNVKIVAFVLLFVKNQSDETLAKTRVMRTLYHEMLTGINLAMELTASPTLLDAFLVLEGVLINILCSRMILGIRHAHELTHWRCSFSSLV
ncbi:uncharacterized protein FOMMEDRAFT_29449 [Fomitiporia mediterranea MF3/22]|uniref:uncharacterized protein n=1 Tax=Fomitiporia mediterranea (strain MF3/22) TaxID=694068 RepID=UPI00044089E3|nr:uncharacterized protein FOMMEDRAFT_29449 [Fomitiporia mediterranea MF3/22]EJD02432.1 hypothetical protein FOMMEDRAFT_29449 [Fomitiporia mediterranea MF3/22]